MVALLEAYVKRVPDSPHLPAMVPPLLAALERSGKPSGTRAMAERLQVTFWQTLSRIEPN